MWREEKNVTDAGYQNFDRKFVSIFKELSACVFMTSSCFDSGEMGQKYFARRMQRTF